MGIIDRKLLWLALSGTGAANLSGADALLDGEAQGLAFDFTDQSVRIIDTSTPSNSTRSTGIVSDGELVGPGGALTYTSPSNKLTRQSDGYFKYQAHNLCLQSETLTTGSWTRLNTNWTASGETPPSPYAGAITVNDDATNGRHIVYQSFTLVSGAAYTAGVVIKAGTATHAALTFDGGSSNAYGVNIDLSTGSVTDTNTTGTVTNPSNSVTDLGGGWYLLTASIGAVNGGTCYVTVCVSNSATPTWSSASPTYAGSSSTIHVTGCVLRRTPSNSDYIRTTTTAKYALPLEYDTSGNCLGLLAEEQRTNILLQSQDAATTWSATQLTVTANDTTAPTGDITGDKLTEAATTNFHFIAQSGLSITAATNYTMSVFVKDGTRRYVQLAFDDGSSGPHATYDLTSVAVTETGFHGGGGYVSSSITAVGNGWYRLSLTGTVGGSAGDRALVFLAPSATPGWAPSYAGNTGNYLYVWGMQLELGSFPTSPILTYGAAATRAVDNISIATSAFPYNQPEGTVYIAFVADYTGGNARIFSLDNGIGVRVLDSYYNSASTLTTYNGTNNIPNISYTDGATTKLSAAYKTADYAHCSNGGSVQTLASATVNTATKLNLGQAGNSTAQLCGIIKAISYVPRRKSDAELATETAL